MQVGVTADYGNTPNGTETMMRMLGRKPAIVHILGDLTYGEAWGTGCSSLAA